MATSPSRKALIWTAAGTVAGVGALVVAVLPGRERGVTVTQSGDGVVQVVGERASAQLIQARGELRGKSLAEARQEARKYATVDPSPGQPAPFLVLDAPHGMWVRSSGDRGGHHVGAVADNSTVWADCAATTDFDPDPADDAGPRWLRVRWPVTAPSDKVYSSQPSDPHTGWLYAGQTVPVGHNGQMPVCDHP